MGKMLKGLGGVVLMGAGAAVLALGTKKVVETVYDISDAIENSRKVVEEIPQIIVVARKITDTAAETTEKVAEAVTDAVSNS